MVKDPAGECRSRIRALKATRKSGQGFDQNPQDVCTLEMLGGHKVKSRRDAQKGGRDGENTLQTPRF